MPNIRPWFYPPRPFADRVIYTPTRPAHLLEYQEEVMDPEGHIYWKTMDSTAVGGFASKEDLLEEMKNFYESNSCQKDKML